MTSSSPIYNRQAFNAVLETLFVTVNSMKILGKKGRICCHWCSDPLMREQQLTEEVEYMQSFLLTSIERLLQICMLSTANKHVFQPLLGNPMCGILLKSWSPLSYQQRRTTQEECQYDSSQNTQKTPAEPPPPKRLEG